MNKIFHLILIFIFVISIGNLYGQCNTQELSSNCVSKVKDGFIFLKSFSIDGNNGSREKVEYSYVFSKDTQYNLNICSGEENTDGIIVTIYDSKRRVASTNFANNKIFPGIIYTCQATGIYYIVYTFDNSLNFCGGSVLAFKK